MRQCVMSFGPVRVPQIFFFSLMFLLCQIHRAVTFSVWISFAETKRAELIRWCDAESLIHSSLSLSHFLIISGISLIFTFGSLLYIACMCTHIPTSRNSHTDTLPHVIRIRVQCDYCRSHVTTDVGSGGAEGAAAPTTARHYTSSLR